MSLPEGVKATRDSSRMTAEGACLEQQGAAKDRSQSSAWCVVYPPEAIAAGNEQGEDDAVSHASSRTIEVMPPGADGNGPNVEAQDCSTPISQITISPRSPRPAADEAEAAGLCLKGLAQDLGQVDRGLGPAAGLPESGPQAPVPFFWRRAGPNQPASGQPDVVLEEPKVPPEARLPKDVTLVQNPHLFAKPEVKAAEVRKGSPTQWRPASATSTSLPSNSSTGSSSASALSYKTTRRVISYATSPPVTRIQQTASAAAPPRRRAGGPVQPSTRSGNSPARSTQTVGTSPRSEPQVVRASSPKTKVTRTESPKVARSPGSLNLQSKVAPATSPRVTRQESPRLKQAGSPTTGAAFPASRPKKGPTRPESPVRSKVFRRPPGATKEDTRTMASPNASMRTARKSIDEHGETDPSTAREGILASLGFTGSRLSISMSNNSLLERSPESKPPQLRPLGGGYSLTAPSRPAQYAARVGSITLPPGCVSGAQSMIVPPAQPLGTPPGGVPRHQSHVPVKTQLARPQLAGSMSWQPCYAAAGYAKAGMPRRVA
mmetsp:Transcript_72455/g.169713  ORF Transcript_72455/g.169713 Transcript_72455/m.169713 type:complete len:547 (+) Transcript_72455:52-1692(+)